MSFADIPERDFEQSDFKRPVFVRLFNGANLRLRILNEKSYSTQKHYISRHRVSINCLGDDACPVCENNRRLMAANPNQKPYQIQGFMNRQNRYLTNVLNRTPIKTTPSGKVVYPINNDFPSADGDTGEILVEIEASPLNQIQVLERGPQLFSQLNLVNDSVINEVGVPLGLSTYDIGISVVGSGRDMVTNVTALSHLNDVVEINEDDLHDLETVGIQLEADEVVRLIEGMTLRDIFSARRGEAEGNIAGDVEQVTAEVKDSVATIFGA